MRVRYEATLAEFTDVYFRQWKRQNFSRAQLFQFLFNAVLLAAIASVPMVIFLSDALWIAEVNFVLVLTACLFLYRYPSDNFYKQYFADFARKQLEGKQTAMVEVEISELGLRYFIFGDEYLSAWQNIREFEETEDTFYFYRKDGGVTTVRKRGFDSAEQMARFFAVANSYLKSSQQLLDG